MQILTAIVTLALAPILASGRVKAKMLFSNPGYITIANSYFLIAIGLPDKIPIFSCSKLKYSDAGFPAGFNHCINDSRLKEKFAAPENNNG